MDARQEDRIAIGLAHGAVAGIGQDESDHVIARDAAERAGLDYLALGHWHSCAEYADSTGVVRMAYSGAHESTKFGERDSGSALLVTLDQRGGRPQIEKVRCGGLSWSRIVLDARERGELTALRKRLEAWADPESTLLDVHLAGVMHPEEQEEVSRIDQIGQSRFLHCRVADDQLLPSPEDEHWLSSIPVGVLREAAQRLRELSSPAYAGPRPEHATPEVAARALMELYTMTRENKS
jgi:DNA repair exonuclease SbcCD nuclease subunit